MHLKMGHIRFYVLLSLIWTACQKAEIEVPWTVRYSSEPNTLSALTVHENPGHLIAVGGQTWHRGVTVESRDGGASWHQDTLGNKQLFGIGTSGSTSVAIGIDGYFFEKRTDDPWQFFRLSHWDILRDLASAGTDSWIAVGGVAFNSGVIYRISGGQIQSVQFFPNELQWIKALDKDHFIAGGFGIVLDSRDAGASWSVSDLTGDFFQDASFISERTGFVVGYAGGVWKTSDAGDHWKKITPTRQFGSLPGLRAIHFIDEHTGMVCGEQGRLWWTSDGGDHWKQIAGLPDKVDWHDGVILADKVIACGSRGTIIEFPLP